jgi:hypothetical protein
MTTVLSMIREPSDWINRFDSNGPIHWVVAFATVVVRLPCPAATFGGLVPASRLIVPEPPDAFVTRRR